MLPKFHLSAAALALACLSPQGALAQSSDACYQMAANLCGSHSLGQCFTYQGNWDNLPDACHGDIQMQIEMDREFEEQAHRDSQDHGAAPSSDQCYETAAMICHTIPLGTCFQQQDAWDSIDASCHGDIQRQIEMDREANEQSGAEIQSGGYVTGMAWGGKMRDGPGMNFRQIDSMTEGEGIEIVSDTGQWYNDFQWYEVIAHGRHGFVWGGNFCHDGGGHMDGSGGACN
ncbi:SH3 domain-containing protein [Fertoebacter nigrum]|uniref:SH3 domain-containing protein n=1 Tax=Fertoeibacter niger TaxID=2656921 RepID=A0A8X8GTS0_9RHOB|nr:SH3 domain-containing protein [Fertoeibacter niger]NUB42942.1 SH3 domain-containing protein [Fertoeibacter niger]